MKNKTKLSSGTTSVSYAAIQYIIENVADFNKKSILIYGLGDIGKNTCKNVLEYTNNKNVTLINRTRKKADEFQNVHSDIKVLEHSKLKKQISNTDVLIVSTGANKPTICTEHIQEGKEILILDLSMPENVALELKERNGVTLVNVDELSKITDKTIATRKEEVPAANRIIDKYKAEFNEWISHRKFVPAVNALKDSLLAIQNEEIDFHSKKIKDFNIEHAEFVTSRMIQKITTQFVKHLKSEHTSVDQSISVINQIFNQEKVEI